jgi:hypothetical protein
MSDSVIPEPKINEFYYNFNKIVLQGYTDNHIRQV